MKTQIFTIRMSSAAARKNNNLFAPRHINNRNFRNRCFGLVLVELMAVFFIITCLLLFVVPNVLDRIQQSRLNQDASQFGHTLRTAAEYAILRGRELVVVIDITDGYYTIYEKQNGVFDRDDSEPVIPQQSLRYCYIEKVDFEDGTHQYSDEIILHATARGWDESVVFNLIDNSDQLQRFVRCDRFTAHVIVKNQLLELLEPQREISMTTAL